MPPPSRFDDVSHRYSCCPGCAEVWVLVVAEKGSVHFLAKIQTIAGMGRKLGGYMEHLKIIPGSMPKKYLCEQESDL